MLATGFASPTEKFIHNRLMIDDFMETNATSTFFFEIESTAYRIFKQNDIIVVDKSKVVRPNCYALVIYEGAFTIVQFTQQQTMIDEKTQQPLSGTIELWGVIVHLIRTL